MWIELNQQVWVCGEVLIDLIPNGKDRSIAVGGGPANTAKALAKLGVATQFIDGISTDHYGQMIIKDFQKNGVLLDFINMSDKPTSQAVVSLNEEGAATYEFIIYDTATFDFSQTWLPNPLSNSVSLLHIGTLATIVEPGASILYEWAKNVALVAPIVFDPNVRPSFMDNREMYVNHVESWIKISSAIKVSNEDIYWLYPQTKIEKVVERWLELGPKLIVVTFGDEGLKGFRLNEIQSSLANKVVVEDTIGAGDTVGAILVEGILEQGLEKLSGKKLKQVLDRAAKAAAITVSRKGASPPTKDEL